MLWFENIHTTSLMFFLMKDGRTSSPGVCDGSNESLTLNAINRKWSVTLETMSWKPDSLLSLRCLTLQDVTRHMVRRGPHGEERRPPASGHVRDPPQKWTLQPSWTSRRSLPSCLLDCIMTAVPHLPCGGCGPEPLSEAVPRFLILRNCMR